MEESEPGDHESMLSFIQGLDKRLEEASEFGGSIPISDEQDNEGHEISECGFSLVGAEEPATSQNAETGGNFVLDRNSYSRALQGAVVNTQSFGLDLQQPWERGPMKMIFQNSPQLDFKCAIPATYLEAGTRSEEKHEANITDQHAVKKQRLGIEQPSFAYCVKCKPDMTYLDKQAADMRLAVGKITALIEMSPNSFQIGRVVLEENESPEGRQEALQETVEVVLSMKSPNTVNKRAGALLLFVKWFLENNRGEPFPIIEKDVAAYLFHLRRSGSFISRGASFRESLRFAHYMLGLEGAINACDSPRIKGAADVMLCRGGTWSPADPLLVNEVLLFHNILDDENRPVLDRIAAGNVLTMVYGRCRASDLALIKKVTLDYGPDGGYLELSTQHHKTSRKATLKKKLLPIVIPVLGINKNNWVEKLLHLRTTSGLSTQDLDNEPWWPAPLETNGDNIVWGNRPIASDEITSWMVSILGTSKTGRKMSSHSAKATCLSWLSKAGVPREDRDVLGRHVTILHGAGPLYARDLISAPMRKLEQTIQQVASKTFLPDENRSGMFTPVAHQCAPETPRAVISEQKEFDAVPPQPSAFSTGIKEEKSAEAILVEESDAGELATSEVSVTESDASLSGGSENEDEQLVAIVPCGLPVKQAPTPYVAGRLFFMHRKSKICHYRDRPLTVGGPMNFFECGRKLSDNFEQIPSVGMRSFKCALCFKNRP